MIESPLTPPHSQSRAGRIFLSLVMGLVLVMGSGALWNGIRLLLEGAPDRAGPIAATVMGAALVGLALWFFHATCVTRPIAEARLARIRSLHPGQPWMERADWAARRMSSSARGPALSMWVWVAGWWGAMGLISAVNGDKIQIALSQSWWTVALVGLFIGAGLAGLWVAIAFTLAWLRYGRSHLTLDTLPAYTGEKFVGSLEARLSPKPTEPIEIQLVCEHLTWIETRSQRRRTTRLRVQGLGAATATADPRRFAPGAQGLRGRIEIDVPAGLPSSNLDERGNGIRWQLRIATGPGDVPFSCSFDIPVYDRRDARLAR